MNRQPLVNNRYQITALLGRGAMGQVYRATDWQTKQEVALKVIARDLALDQEMLGRFRREGEALRQLRHRNIVAFVEMFDFHGHQVIVMEYVSGGNLHALIQQAELPLPRVREIALDLCDALICAHRLNIVHRDIKPKNILLTEDGVPKLADFGVARLMESNTALTSSGTIMGTPHYMSPEAWEGQVLDAQTDVWSLGVVLFEMLTGQVPFGGETTAAVMKKVLTASLPDIRTLRPDTPEALADIVERALMREKARRYPTVRMMSLDIDQCLLAPAMPDASLLAPVAPAEEEPLPEVLRPFPAASAAAPPPGELPPAPPSAEPTPAAEATPTPVAPAKGSQAWWESTAVLVGVGVLALLCLLIAAGLGWRALTGQSRPASPTVAPLISVSTAAVSTPLGQTPAATARPTDTAATPTHAPSSTSAPVAPTPVPSPTPGSPQAAPSAQPTLGIGSTQVSPQDGMTLLYVAAGDFLMGSTNAEVAGAFPDSGEKPQHSVYVDAFWIDKTDVTNAMFARFIQATSYKTDAEKAGSTMIPDLTSGQGKNVPGADWQHPSGKSSDINGMDNYPVVLVSWNDAAEYCKWAGRQLPTEAEWEKAARGPATGSGEGGIYPWGNGPVAGNLLNFRDKNLSIAQADKAVDDGYQTASPVGHYPDGASPYGALDMAGNVWQWVADWYDVNYYATSPNQNPTGPKNGQIAAAQNSAKGGPFRVMRGGSWYNVARLARTANRGTGVPDSRSTNIGFRCAAH